MNNSTVHIDHSISSENNSDCHEHEEESEKEQSPSGSFRVEEKSSTDASTTSSSSQSEDEMELMIAGLFDTFMEIKDYIGGGTFGRVYTANFRDNASQEVVVKFVKRISQQSDMEAILMMKMQHHPNVIECIDFFRNRDYVQIITKSHGTEVINFRKYLSQVPCLNENICRFFFQQILAAVSFIHQNDIAHLDLKPANAIINSRLQIQIIDFGLARDLQKDGNGPFIGNCGTRCFMPPEMLIEKSYFAKQADVWSLGVIFFESFFSTMPYKISKSYEFTVPPKHPVMEMTRPFSSDLKNFLEGMLCIDIDQRFAIDTVLNHQWFKGSCDFDQDTYNPFNQVIAYEPREAENVTKTIEGPVLKSNVALLQCKRHDDFMVLCGEQQGDDSSPPEWLSSEQQDDNTSPPQWLLCEPNQANGLSPSQLISCEQQVLDSPTPDSFARESLVLSVASVTGEQNVNDTIRQYNDDSADKPKQSLFTPTNIARGIRFTLSIALNVYHGGLGSSGFLWL